MEKHTSSLAHQTHYPKLALMVVLSFIAMYVLMYAMVDRLDNVLPNINQFYMAGLMTSAMVLIEIVIMSMMYHNRKLNIIIVVLSLLALIGCYAGIRQQIGVSDKQFLKSMIPHHAAAILMCKSADLSDPEIKELCKDIMAGQQKEINQMQTKLKTY
ncbi:DUF305 domain-containing protein [Polluticoccus soli]|uniref:DUF305 domain-containing protein n=1 Tax=Polluticoccus soli TaxID=3034150 RepID=UPI0023E1AF4F|nr:DUF305 domain-containing protein [Flavipsychrobacter sp. JY13-12]